MKKFFSMRKAGKEIGCVVIDTNDVHCYAHMMHFGTVELKLGATMDGNGHIEPVSEEEDDEMREDAPDLTEQNLLLTYLEHLKQENQHIKQMLLDLGREFLYLNEDNGQLYGHRLAKEINLVTGPFWKGSKNNV